jgi:glycosyltransferase involved in cell wall biosynthesis
LERTCDETAQTAVKVACCILAKSEAKSIAGLLGQLRRQSLVRNGRADVSIHVVANGCTDETAAVALRCAEIFNGTRASLHVHELETGGKSRAWNRAVHGLVDSSAEYFVFLDADITFVDESVIDELLGALQAQPDAEVSNGYPVKDVGAKRWKSPLDVFSLAVSKRSQQPTAINGQLYVARTSALEDIWLPDETPGEDGFLNAMVTTRGFTMAPVPGKVIGARSPTHYYRTHRAFGFFPHDRRMIVGTMINIWIFEYLWSLGLTSPAGELIRQWNESDPDWVERLIRIHSAKRTWLVPKSILLGRFTERSLKPWWKRVGYLPAAIAATILTIPPAIAANAKLKRRGAASTW